jgi:TolB-like protein
MRILPALLIIPATLFAQDPLADLATKLAQQLTGRQIRSVAVLRFTNGQNYDTQLSANLVDQLNRALVTQGPQGQNIEVASRSQSDALLKEMRLPDTMELNSKDLETLATRLNVDALVTGTFAVSPDSVAVDTTLLDGKTSHIIGGASIKLPRAGLEQFLVEKKGPPPTVAPVSIPTGTTIDMKLSEKVDAASAKNGRTISATLADNIVNGTVIVAKKGADVKLQATSPDGMELHLTLASIALTDGRTVPAVSAELIKAATSSRSKGALGGVLGGIQNGGTIGIPQNAPAQMKPAEMPKDAPVSLKLTQDAR